jgi:hypothetical protein
MRRPLYFTEMAAQPFPLGLLGCVLQGYKEVLQTFCFLDNEVGDSAGAATAYQTKVVLPVNKLLKHNRKPLCLCSIGVDHSRHHTVEIKFGVRTKARKWEYDTARLSLFLASKKSIAMERKAEEDGEEFTVVAPRRGVVPVKRPKNRKWKKKDKIASTALA